MKHDYELFNEDRREVMAMQVQLSYRAYIYFKLERLEEEYSKYVEAHWLGRQQEHLDMMKDYSKAIDTTRKLIKSIEFSDRVELEMEELREQNGANDE